MYLVLKSGERDAADESGEFFFIYFSAVSFRAVKGLRKKKRKRERKIECRNGKSGQWQLHLESCRKRKRRRRRPMGRIWRSIKSKKKKKKKDACLCEKIRRILKTEEKALRHVFA